jgi:Flp pilus assembly protein TadD
VQVWKQLLLAEPSNKAAREHLSSDERDRNAADGNAIVSPATMARSQRSMTQPMAAVNRALQQKNTALAEQRFHAILLREPGNTSAMGGLGYAAMQRQDFSSALHWLELAQRHGGNNAGVRRAIGNLLSIAIYAGPELWRAGKGGSRAGRALETGGIFQRK